MNVSPHAIIFGEALVDFLPERAGPLRAVERFRKVSGGAPANVAIGMARLGARPRLLTRLGEDEFGYFLRDTMASEGVDVSGVRFTDEARTGITFVYIDEDGERGFMPYRNHSADLTVRPEDFRDEAMAAPVLHLGSNLMPYATGRHATFDILERARAAGCLISFDANIRIHLWDSEQEALEIIEAALRLVDLVKLSDEEMVFLGGNPEEPWPFYARMRSLGVRWLALTYGPGGARLLGPDGLDVARPARAVEVVDTTGAGDGFLAGFLTGMLRQLERRDLLGCPGVDLPTRLDAHDWERVLDLANFTGSSTCAVLGATGGLPLAADVPWRELGWDVATAPMQPHAVHEKTG